MKEALTLETRGTAAGLRRASTNLLERDKSEARRGRQALVRVCKTFARSAWARIDLRPEEQVRDFLADMMLDEPRLAELLSFALKVASSPLGDDEMKNAFAQARENIVLLVSEKLPRRGQLLLHVRQG